MEKLDMSTPDRIIRNAPGAVEQRLRELGLTPEILIEAARSGELERASCTPLDPPSAAGFEAWRCTVRRLRELLKPSGWRAINDRNLPLVVHPMTGVAIAVTSGDQHTGTRLTPTTLHAKGATAFSYVSMNRRQALLFPAEQRFVPTPHKDERVTWLLLVSSQPPLVSVELSLPASIDEDGYIDTWRERLILKPFQLDQPTKETPHEAPPIDVIVTPKTQR